LLILILFDSLVSIEITNSSNVYIGDTAVTATIAVNNIWSTDDTAASRHTTTSVSSAVPQPTLGKVGYREHQPSQASLLTVPKVSLYLTDSTSVSRDG